MAWLFPSIIATIASTFVLVVIYFYLYTQERKHYIKLWAFGWGLYLVRFFFELLLYLQKGALFLTILNGMFTIASGVFLLWGTYSFLEKPISKIWTYTSVISFLWLLLGSWYQIPFSIYILPAYLFLGIIYIWTGKAFLNSTKLTGMGKNITGGAFVLWGIHKLDYPFLKPLIWFAPWGYLIAAVLTLIVAIGILLVYFEETKKGLIEAENNLKQYQLLSKHVRDIILFIRYQDGQIIEANQAALEAYGYKNEEIIKLKIYDLQDQNVLDNIKTQMEQSLKEGILFNTYHRRKNGEKFPVEISLLGVDFGQELVILSIIRDITERHEAENELKRLSTYDALTGLYNRHQFEAHLNCLESKVEIPVGIIVCDIDGLKFVNDTFGHKMGDLHIQRAASIIKECFRENDMVFRIGGDEFAIILSNKSVSFIEITADRLREAFGKYNSEVSEILVNISVGFATRTIMNNNLENVFKEADDNMYKEKLYNKNSRRSSVVKTLTKMLEVRDFITEGHAKRMKKLIEKLLYTFGSSRQNINDILLFTEFHDIGKVGISDQILFKLGPLTDEERIEMQRHSEIGHRIALSIPELSHIADWILKHHEWWNGKGYPLGLKGKEIPLECRILAIVDAYDAMTNDRPYRGAMSHSEAVKELRRYVGIQFDPDIAEKFIELIEKENRSV